MENHEQLKARKRQYKGQTLVEFGLTLPLLLILIFGIIEFGRIFQAWVTLQNSAREATRYATTGQYNEERYDIDVVVPCFGPTLDDPLINPDLRGTLNRNYRPNPLDPSYEIEVYEGGLESLYATWYQGENCDHGNIDHQNRRKDLLRLVSIMDEARRGAAGLSLNTNPIAPTEESVRDMIFGIWDTPQVGSEQRSWFNVMICSSRLDYYNQGNAYVSGLPGDHDSRFLTILDEDDALTRYEPTPANSAVVVEAIERYEEPFCMLNEHLEDGQSALATSNGVQPPNGGATQNNGGIRWLDAGDSGDRINLVVTFNHPLITPLGLADYIQMEARRSGIVESFRVNAALSSSVGGAPGAGAVDTPTPLPPTSTPLPTATSTATSTASVTPSASPSPTESPFTCQGLVAQDVEFSGTYINIRLTNLNAQPTRLDRVDLRWRIETGAEYQGRYLAATGVNNETYWTGNEPGGTGVDRRQDTADFVSGTPEYDDFVDADRTITSGDALWRGLFLNSGGQLSTVFRNYDFGGSVFYFYNPLTGGQCPITLQVPPVPDPDDIPDPPPGSTDTYTPDCASSNVSVQWVGFDSFGVVRLRIVNNRPNAVADLTGFTIVWPNPTDLGLSPGIFNLDKIAIGGNNPDDPRATIIWRGPDLDQSPPTLPSHSAGGLLTTYSFPPSSTTNLYLDFSGTGSTLNSAFGVEAYMFNGTWFDIGCGSNGGSGGPGGGDDGRINLATSVPPPPSNTPRPTNTPGPTRTPTPTRPTNTPSNTWTPGPPPTSTNTLPPSLTPSITPQLPPPTQDTIGGGE